MSETITTKKENRLGEIAVAFLRLGFIAFGGAVAHIALMEEEFVRRRGWLSRDQESPAAYRRRGEGDH